MTVWLLSLRGEGEEVILQLQVSENAKKSKDFYLIGHDFLALLLLCPIEPQF